MSDELESKPDAEPFLSLRKEKRFKSFRRGKPEKQTEWSS